jgi:O-antigen ligase
VIGMAVLGERAFPWAVVIVAVAPWYPFISTQAEAPLVRQKVLCAAIAIAPIVPWLWSLAIGGRRSRPQPAALLMGILFGGLTLLIYETRGSVTAMILSGTVGFMFLGVTFLLARRFGAGRGLPAAAFGGLVALLLMGADAYVRSPGTRVGYFVGYPITYGALVVGLLPLALLFAYRRSRLLAGIVVAASAALLIFCESRSSWVAGAFILIVAVLLQARAGNFKGIAAAGTIVVVLTALVLGTGSLHHIVEQKLSARVESSQSVTHRVWSYHYAFEKIGREPLFGAGAPGFAAAEANNKTSIGAIDNGYVSIAVDMGLVGLLAVLVPLGVAVRAVARCVRFGVTPSFELALALGIIAMAVVTAFYDSFYWAQIDLMMGLMGGVLSRRIALIRRAPRALSETGAGPAAARLHRSSGRGLHAGALG